MNAGRLVVKSYFLATVEFASRCSKDGGYGEEVRFVREVTEHGGAYGAVSVDVIVSNVSSVSSSHEIRSLT